MAWNGVHTPAARPLGLRGDLGAEGRDVRRAK
jgi:hypothetical protein